MRSHRVHPERYPLLAAAALCGWACLVLSPAASAQTLLVVNKSGNSLSVIDVGTRASLATIATGNAPHEVAASPDGRWAAVEPASASSARRDRVPRPGSGRWR